MIDTTTFVLGALIGAALLVGGVAVGWWWARRSSPGPPREQMLDLLHDLASWTNEVSGDVSKYQTELSRLGQQIASSKNLPPEQIQGLLTRMMQLNRDLQLRLDEAEGKLDSQTEQVENYLRESRTDGLTGLLNRRAFDAELDELYVRWQRKHQPFSLALIDIDHFKRINDTYGHPAGDAVLRLVAQSLRNHLGMAECIARYGGEEFAVLSLTSLERTAGMIDALRAAVAQTQFDHEGEVIPVTLSGGVAGVAAGDTIGDVVRRADEALYASKLGGRNRVNLHDGTICRLVTAIPPGSAVDEAGDRSDAERVHSRIEERLRSIVLDESRKLSD